MIFLPDNLRGRSLHANVIPTVCNVRNMLGKLVSVNDDYGQLKNWEKRSYKSYQIEKIKNRILAAEPSQWKGIIREHILANRPSDFGPAVIDIYLVAYVAETFGPGKETFFRYVFGQGITEKVGSAQAIWQVGKGDGVYLDILNQDGTVKDWAFMQKWIEGKSIWCLTI